MSESTAHEVSTAVGDTLNFRTELADLYRNSPLPPDDLMFNLGMYVRGSLLVKFLVMDDLYKRVKHIPGAFMEFGTWWGQNLVLMENLRAIHEPFNKQRKIIGFDTFAGYPETANLAEQSTDRYAGYQTATNYEDYLRRLLEVHEGNNAFGHIRGNHRVITGDVRETVPTYFDDHPETIVAFAFFDMGPYEPTVASLKAIKPNMVPGSIIMFDELTWDGAPGEAVAFKEVFAGTSYDIEKCELYPSKSVVTLK